MVLSQEDIDQLRIERKKSIQFRKKKGLVYDRYTIIFILFFVSIILFFVLVKNKKTALSAIPLAVSVLLLLINTMSAGRIRKNEYEGNVKFKGEKDCGFTTNEKKKIDGVMVRGTTHPVIYKTANGTDLTIDKKGNVHPVGFGSRFVNYLAGGGYKNTPPNACWEEK